MRSEPDDRGGAVGGIDGELPASIDGLTPSTFVAPATAQEVAEVLADAAERGLAVAPVGAGTALALGNPPDRLDLVLSTARLREVIDYEPTDLVLSVGAGARLGDVQTVLAEHGQELPIDPPRGDEATIGGLIATGLAGPRRLAAGTLRDLLIGVAVAHPSGTVTKAGGMVVKNVTGFDLPRIYHGSLGTLGIVVSANFKVLPLPRAEATVTAAAPSWEAAVAAAERLRSSRLDPAALDVMRRDGAWSIGVRLMGREATVGGLADEARALLVGETAVATGAESAAWWRGYTADQAAIAEGDDVVVRISVRPRAVGGLIGSLVRLEEEQEVQVGYLGASVGVGSVVLRLRLAGDNPASRLAALREALLTLADQVVVLAAPSAWKRGFDVWGRPPETIDVMRSLKHQFDPVRVLNPGRFAGRI